MVRQSSACLLTGLFLQPSSRVCCGVLWCRLRGGKQSSSSAGSRADEEQWRKWVDERFVKVLTANIYRTWE
jgi:hypothetical protein